MIRRDVTVASAIFLVLAGAVVLLHIDISAAQDFELDSMVRDAFPDAANRGVRFVDPSPSSIWIPSDWHVRESIRSATLPFWDRLQGGGYSPVITLYNGVFHPARWIVAAVPRPAASSVLILIALHLAFLGMLLLARDLFASSSAAMTAAIVFAFGPVAMSMVQFSGSILAMAHLPWLAFFYRLATRGSRPAQAAFAITLALMLMSGHPLIVFGLGLAVMAFVLADVSWSKSWRSIGVAAFGGAAGVALASFALLPPIFAAKDLWSYKTASSAGTPYQHLSLPAWLTSLFAQVVDDFRDAPCCYDTAPFYLYLGIPTLVLVLLGFGALWRARERRWIVCTVIFWAIAIPGPWMAMFERLRPLSFLKPWYLMPAFVFFLAIASGRGALAAMQRRERIWRIAAAALWVTVPLTYLPRMVDALDPHTWREIGRSQAVDSIRGEPQPVRMTALWGQTHLPNASRITGIEDARLSGPMVPVRYVAWWDAVDPDVVSRSYPTVRITDHLESALVGDFNIGFVAQSRLPFSGTFYTVPDQAGRDMMLSPRLLQLELKFRGPSVEIRRIAGRVHERAEFAERVECVPSFEAARHRLASDPQLAGRTAVVERDPPVAIPAPRDARVSLKYPDERHVAIGVSSGSGGLVVLHDAYAPGWTATVDGVESPIYPVNILSRGVFVPPGEHTVEMSYVPPGFILGASIAALVLAVLVVRSFRRARAGTETPHPASPSSASF